jgi:hypothetical protein
MPSVPTSQTLGARQLVIYLKERGVDPASIPLEAIGDMIEMASAALDLTELRNSQAMVKYMGLLKSYSEAIADYCVKPGEYRKVSDQAIYDILKEHGVPPALD